jgi:hypothetical protein
MLLEEVRWKVCSVEGGEQIEVSKFVGLQNLFSLGWNLGDL